MSVTLHTLRTSDGFYETVECFPTLDECLSQLGVFAWEEPSNRWLDVITDDSGEAVAVAIFGPGLELLVTCADGRRLAFPMPEFYRTALEGS